MLPFLQPEIFSEGKQRNFSDTPWICLHFPRKHISINFLIQPPPNKLSMRQFVFTGRFVEGQAPKQSVIVTLISQLLESRIPPRLSACFFAGISNRKTCLYASVEKLITHLMFHCLHLRKQVI